MTGFLRKKVKHDAQPNPIAANSAADVSTTTVAPLFARFATTYKPADEVTSTRIVSSPMVLSSPSTRRDVGRTHFGNDGHGARAINGVRGDEADRRKKKPSVSGRIDVSSNSSPYVVSPPATHQPQSGTALPVRLVSPTSAQEKPLPPTLASSEENLLYSKSPSRYASTRGPPPVSHSRSVKSSRVPSFHENKPLPQPAVADGPDYTNFQSRPAALPQGVHRDPTSRTSFYASPTPEWDQPSLPTPPSHSSFPRHEYDVVTQPEPEQLHGMQPDHQSIYRTSAEAAELPPEFALFQDYNTSFLDPSAEEQGPPTPAHSKPLSDPREMATYAEALRPEIDSNSVISERQPEYTHNNTHHSRNIINYSRRLLPQRPDAPASPPTTPPMMPTASPVPPTQTPPTPRKSSSLKSEISPMRRKPLIFAAMADSHDSELSTPPPPPTAWNNSHHISPYPTPPAETLRATTHTGSALSSYAESRYNQSTSSFATALGDEPSTSISTPAPIDNVLQPTSHASYEPRMKPQIEQQAPPATEPPPPPPSSTKKKSSRSRTTESSSHSRSGSHAGSTDHRHHHRTLVKPRPTSPKHVVHLDPPVELDQEVIRKAGLPLDDDPFAKAEVVKMPKPAPRADTPLSDSPSKRPRTRDGLHSNSGTPHGSTTDLHGEGANGNGAILPATPNSPDAYHQARSRRREKPLEKAPPQLAHDITIKPDRPPEPFPLILFVSDPRLLSFLLSYFSFYDWCILFSVSKQIRTALVESLELREVVLERYLRTVGYSRWMRGAVDPLPLSLQDLCDYMRGVSTPTHEYARVADLYVQSLLLHPSNRDESLYETVQELTASTRAYTRVVLRLRAQADKETSSRASGQTSKTAPSRASSRAPSPHSSLSHGHTQNSTPAPPSMILGTTFRSPLYKLRRAPLLRVFVPSPDGDWLSDRSVVECEAELRRAGVLDLLRMGDVVWDVAVSDEGNIGRLVWDGMYLIDLDYTFSPVGDLPKYMPTLAFPPSYFHRVIRTGPSTSNPIVHIDLSPWGEQIAANLQLLQDRVRTETPQGAYHNVVRWVNRSSFSITPPAKPARTQSQAQRSRYTAPRIPIPNSNGLFVDHGWYGTIVVETEGTPESLADLQDRCGPGAFPPRPAAVNGQSRMDAESKHVFRILREKSRPGEIWIRTVGPKERLL